MIGSKILSLALAITNKAQANFLDGTTATAYERLNTSYGHRILDILRVRVDRNASIQEATTDLMSTVGIVAGDNGFNGEYAFPSDLLKPVRFEISYDGLRWVKATIYDNAINLGSEYNDTQLVDGFSTEEPRVDFIRNSYKIRPPKTTSGNITKGIYIEYEKRQADFTDSTSPSEIETNLQDILAYDLAEYDILQHTDKYSSNQITMIRNKRAENEARFLEFYKGNLPKVKTITFQLPRTN